METGDGIVIRIDGGGHHVDLAGETLRCRVRGRLFRRTRETLLPKNPVAVGDQVRVARTAPGEGVIEEVHPRRTRLSRPANDGTRREHLVAANVDQALVVVSSHEPPIRYTLIDRVLIAAERGGMKGVVCLNKIDLDIKGAVREQVAIYERIGYSVLYTSATARQGLVSLREALQGKTTVLAGHSGTGKSSLLNALLPGLSIRIAEVSESTGKGRHTTSSASLLPLEFGGYVVDTPGFRAFGLSGVEAADVAIHYPEMRPYIDRCRFKDCLHLREPGCEVLAALERGDLSRLRHESYAKIVESIKAGLEGEERVSP
ncbi:MAG: ribosome small subunit-dependent GTPase A [Planctomycetes bacterium]|nr:ribosome small subunit-dependent GTPase A [Planctomycetota bacterium]